MIQIGSWGIFLTFDLSPSIDPLVEGSHVMVEFAMPKNLDDAIVGLMIDMEIPWEETVGCVERQLLGMWALLAIVATDSQPFVKNFEWLQ